MPIYEYRCRNDHSFEVFQSMSDDPVATCAECGAPTERVFHPVAVHFKGSGFYTTDYARKGASKADGDGGASKADGDGGSSKADGDGGSSKPESDSGSKPEAKPDSSKNKAETGSG